MRIDAPAKLNLFLKVTGQRADGYHELYSLMCPVALYDALTITLGGDAIRVSCSHPAVPVDGSNLVARAARLFFDTLPAATAAVSGVHIHIDKCIPVGAGLGGGSSDAAAVLTTLNRQLGSPLPASTLVALGSRIGADVPFFIDGVPALATGIGDRLEPFSHLGRWTALLVYPDVAVSTAWVYKNLNLRLTKDEKKLSKFHFNGRFFSLDEHLVNDLEPVTASVFPVIKTIKRLLLAAGAAGAMMTGSGSTVFGLFADRHGAESARAGLTRRPQARQWKLYVADLLV